MAVNYLFKIYFVADHGFFLNSHLNNNSTILKKLSYLSNNILNNFKCDTDLLLFGGDNFYPNGITKDNYKELVNNYNKFFNKSFRHSIYGLLGNHDYKGNYKLQINNNDIFKIPDTYYKISKDNYDIYMIDTIILSPNFTTHNINLYHSIFDNDYYNFDTKNSKLTNTEKLYEIIKLKNKMLKWLNIELDKSNKNGKKIIVCGHYNLLSYGMYKFNNYINLVYLYLMPLFVKYNVHLYISGHDHTTQLHYIDGITLWTIYKNQYLYETVKEEYDLLFPGYIDNMNNNVDYYIYNIVSGASIDNYNVNKYNYDYQRNNITEFENFEDNLYLKLNILNNDGDIAIEFIKNDYELKYTKNLITHIPCYYQPIKI